MTGEEVDRFIASERLRMAHVARALMIGSEVYILLTAAPENSDAFIDDLLARIAQRKAELAT